MSTHRIAFAAVAAAASLVMSACAGGGASDTVGAAADAQPAAGASTVNLFAYAVPKVGYDKLIPAFQATEAGKGVQFQQSYGASGDQSRKVEAGAEADFVNFSVEPDITRLVDAGLVDASWNSNEYQGIPFGSVVTIVVREGNPQGIEDWDDLLQPGVEVVTPNPFSSGSAKWNLLAPYAAKSNGGTDQAAGLAYVSELVGDHVKIQPKSGPRGDRGLPPGVGRRAPQLRERGAVHRAQVATRSRTSRPADLQDREPGGRAHQERQRREGQGVQRVPLHPGGAAAVGRGRVPPGGHHGRRRVRQGLPPAREALDHRRPRRLEAGRLDAVQEGRRLHRQDLRRGHPVGAADDDHSPREDRASRLPARVTAGRRTVLPDGAPARGAAGRTLGLGVVGLWLSVIVLLPLAALTARAFEDGLAGFWEAVTAPVALAALAVTLGVSPPSRWSTR